MVQKMNDDDKENHNTFITPNKAKDTLMLWNTPDDREFLEEQFNQMLQGNTAIKGDFGSPDKNFQSNGKNLFTSGKKR